MSAADELKVTKRIDPDRIGRVLKQNRDTMMAMAEEDPAKFRALIKQAEVDMKRCADASETLRLVAHQLTEVMITGYDVAITKRVRIE
ncbi:hypothetical protein QLT00_gp17 [Gordonia phage Commandaria]|uniref:Uncharacterized protein n=1 Tax=Gordonia phage Commandaria TaxID=3038364 RepID=A0AAF0K0X8_9CAUD|nr:hypothetical protein QLT00_gp17 [Gordonia phage Commandaria]WGH20800.1 hypothetical protein [Gordonia phage Commandaria]